jgi:hypothetical protein
MRCAQVSFTLTMSPYNGAAMTALQWATLRTSLACYLGLPPMNADFGIYVDSVATAAAGGAVAVPRDHAVINSPDADTSACDAVMHQPTISRRQRQRRRRRAMLPQQQQQQQAATTITTTTLPRGDSAHRHAPAHAQAEADAGGDSDSLAGPRALQVTSTNAVMLFAVVLPASATTLQLPSAVRALQANATRIAGSLAAWALAPAVLRANLSVFLVQYAVAASSAGSGSLNWQDIAVTISDIRYSVPGVGASTVPAAVATADGGSSGATTIVIGASVAGGVSTLVALIVLTFVVRRYLARRAQQRMMHGAASRDDDPYRRRRVATMKERVAAAAATAATTRLEYTTTSTLVQHNAAAAAVGAAAAAKGVLLSSTSSTSLDGDSDVAVFAPMPLRGSRSEVAVASPLRNASAGKGESLEDALHSAPLPKRHQHQSSGSSRSGSWMGGRSPQARPGIGVLQPQDVQDVQSRAPKVAGSWRQTAQLFLADNPMPVGGSDSR